MRMMAQRIPMTLRGNYVTGGSLVQSFAKGFSILLVSSARKIAA